MNKGFWRSKACWGGLLIAAGGIATAVGQYFTGNLDLASLFNTVIPLVGNGLGIIGIRLAV